MVKDVKVGRKSCKYRALYQFLPFEPIFTNFYPFLPIFTHFYPFLPIFTHFYPFLPILTHFHHFYPFNPFSPFLPIFATFYHFYYFLPIFTNFYPFLPFLTTFTHFLSNITYLLFTSPKQLQFLQILTWHYTHKMSIYTNFMFFTKIHKMQETNNAGLFLLKL